MPSHAADVGVAAVFVAWLGALAWMDARTHRLPDVGTLGLSSVGFLLSGLTPAIAWQSPHDAALGFAAGWLLPNLLDGVYRLRKGTPGTGQGDAKLLAAMGVWLGPLAVVPVWGLATVAALAWSLMRRTQSLAFGPWIAGAGACILLWTWH